MLPKLPHPAPSWMIMSAMHPTINWGFQTSSVRLVCARVYIRGESKRYVDSCFLIIFCASCVQSDGNEEQQIICRISKTTLFACILCAYTPKYARPVQRSCCNHCLILMIILSCLVAVVQECSVLSRRMYTETPKANILVFLLAYQLGLRCRYIYVYSINYITNFNQTRWFTPVWFMRVIWKSASNISENIHLLLFRLRRCHGI